MNFMRDIAVAFIAAVLAAVAIRLLGLFLGLLPLNKLPGFLVCLFGSPAENEQASRSAECYGHGVERYIIHRVAPKQKRRCG